MNEYMTLEEVKEYLNAQSTTWLCSEVFGECVDSEWRFVRAKVYELKARLDVLRDKNARGDVSLPDECVEEGEDPPLL